MTLGNERILRFIPWAAFALFILGNACALWWQTGSQFSFTLDDAYIHLSLAENLARGSYSFNLGEASSPSSSILWPFLLVPFFWLSIPTLGPWALNLVTAGASVWLVLRITRFILGPTPITLMVTLGQCLLVIALNLPGLVFLGMEHGLQVTCSLAIAYGLLRLPEVTKPPLWLWVAMMLAPLLRYESLAVSGVAYVLLLLRGHRLSGLAVGAGIIVLLAMFSAYLHQLGLPLLPLSLLKKLSMVQGMPLWAGLLNPYSWVLMVLLALLLNPWAAPQAGTRALKFPAVAVLVSQLLLSTANLRYEAYAIAYTLPILLACYQAPLRQFMLHPTPWLAALRMGVACLCLAWPYASYTLWQVPYAGRNIVEMHHTLHQFAVQYWQAPIMTNDIGRVKYENPHYVLDVVGLANPRAQALNQDVLQHPNRRWLAQLSTEYNIDAAILFDRWFAPQIPPQWVKLAELSLSCCNVTLPQDTMSFYATGPASAPALRRALERFAAAEPATAKRLRFIGQP